MGGPGKANGAGGAGGGERTLCHYCDKDRGFSLKMCHYHYCYQVGREEEGRETPRVGLPFLRLTQHQKVHKSLFTQTDKFLVGQDLFV